MPPAACLSESHINFNSKNCDFVEELPKNDTNFISNSAEKEKFREINCMGSMLQSGARMQYKFKEKNVDEHQKVYENETML
jgi:hypothetical protein